ncbi:MAG: hypothetical protein PHO33_02650 [Clostridia bacterium]|nr:hypothetical protein [Clostridia bacterium]
MDKILVNDLWIIIKKDINNANVIRFGVCNINELGTGVFTELSTNTEHIVNYSVDTNTVTSLSDNFTARTLTKARSLLSYDSNALLFGLEFNVFFEQERKGPIKVTKLIELENKINKIEYKCAIKQELNK